MPNVYGLAKQKSIHPGLFFTIKILVMGFLKAFLPNNVSQNIIEIKDQ